MKISGSLFVIEERRTGTIEWHPIAPHAYLDFYDAVPPMNRMTEKTRDYQYRIFEYIRFPEVTP